MGHSRDGWHVADALAFSSFPFAAAIVDENIDSGYFEAGFAGWTDEQMRNGAKPFGPGMKGWLENSPAFSVEHVRSPLLMVISDSFAGRAGVVAQGWEMFSRLRYLGKPVEFWAVPNIERRSEEHTSALQSLMRISYAVFCLKKKN